MVSHDNMHDVIGAALRHVTRDAVLRRIVSGRVATLTSPDVAPRALFSLSGLVRVMARRTCKRAVTFQEAGRFQKPIGGVSDFELVFVARAWSVVEVEGVILERLSRPEGEKAAAEPPQRVRKVVTGGFQMTLEAQFELSLRAEAAGFTIDFRIASSELPAPAL